MESNLGDYTVNRKLEVRDECGISYQCTSFFSTLVNKKTPTETHKTYNIRSVLCEILLK